MIDLQLAAIILQTEEHISSEYLERQRKVFQFTEFSYACDESVLLESMLLLERSGKIEVKCELESDDPIRGWSGLLRNLPQYLKSPDGGYVLEEGEEAFLRVKVSVQAGWAAYLDRLAARLEKKTSLPP